MKRVVVLALVALAGCKGLFHRKDECLKHQPYEDAVSVAALHGAGDLPPPANKQALKIPDVANSDRPRVQCLDVPPKFQEATSQPKPKANDRFHTPVPSTDSKEKSQ